MKLAIHSAVLLVVVGCLAVSGCGRGAMECTPKYAIEHHRSEIRKLGVGDDWKVHNLSTLAPKLEPGLLILRLAPGNMLDGPEAFLKFRRKDCELVFGEFHATSS